MAKILVVDTSELDALIFPFDGQKNDYVYNQNLLSLFAKCVGNDTKVIILYPQTLAQFDFIAVKIVNAIMGNIRNKLRNKKKANLVTQEFTDDVADRIAKIAAQHDQTLLITANSGLKPNGVDIFVIDPTDPEAGPLTIDLIYQKLFGGTNSDDEIYDAGRRSPPLRLFEGLSPAPEPDHAPGYHQH